MALHRDLTGADLHEPKGADTASTGTILRANGSGGTSWVNPVSNTNIQYSSVISASKTSNILPVALDTPVTAGFDASVSNSDISINSSGLITILTPGLYDCTFNMNFGRVTSSGVAYLAARLLLNGSQFGFTQGASLDNNITTRPMQANLELSLSASDTLQVQVIRDSSGVNEGGLVTIPLAPVDWPDIPSFWARLRKVIGAS